MLDRIYSNSNPSSFTIIAAQLEDQAQIPSQTHAITPSPRALPSIVVFCAVFALVAAWMYHRIRRVEPASTVSCGNSLVQIDEVTEEEEEVDRPPIREYSGVGAQTSEECITLSSISKLGPSASQALVAEMMQNDDFGRTLERLHGQLQAGLEVPEATGDEGTLAWKQQLYEVEEEHRKQTSQLEQECHDLSFKIEDLEQSYHEDQRTSAERIEALEEQLAAVTAERDSLIGRCNEQSEVIEAQKAEIETQEHEATCNVELEVQLKESQHRAKELEDIVKQFLDAAKGRITPPTSSDEESPFAVEESLATSRSRLAESIPSSSLLAGSGYVQLTAEALVSHDPCPIQVEPDVTPTAISPNDDSSETGSFPDDQRSNDFGFESSSTYQPSSSRSHTFISGDGRPSRLFQGLSNLSMANHTSTRVPVRPQPEAPQQSKTQRFQTAYHAKATGRKKRHNGPTDLSYMQHDLRG